MASKKDSPARAAVIAAIRLLRDRNPQCEAYHPKVIEAAIPAEVMAGLTETHHHYREVPVGTKVVREEEDGTIVHEQRFKKEISYTYTDKPDISAVCVAAARDGHLRRHRVLLPKDERGPKTTVALYDLAEPRTDLQIALAEAWHHSLGDRDYGYGGLPQHIRDEVEAEVKKEMAQRITHITIEGRMRVVDSIPENGFALIRGGRAVEFFEEAPKPKERKTRKWG